MRASLSLLSLLLPLLLLGTSSVSVSSTAVHEVAISVRSVRSVTYLGTQVSIFQHVSMPLRYFFQPLSFFDASSVRVVSDTELGVTRLHVDVYMWTEEFLQLVRSHFPGAESVELMPLTQIRLSWSQQAGHWLGRDFNESLRLLDGWLDADKPQMRTTFTVACDTNDSCRRLQRRLNGSSSEAAENVFDLQYRVPFADSRNATLTVRSVHLLRSPTYQQLRRFAATRPGLKRVLVSDETVDAVVDEAFAAAVSQLQEELRKEVASIDAGARGSALRRLQRQLRADAVDSPTPRQWSVEVFWPPARRNLRPDRLAKVFNLLFRRLSAPLTVGVVNDTSATLEAVRDSLPAPEAAALKAFVEQHSPRRAGNAPPPPIVADDVRELALSLGSSVSWDAAAGRFAASPTARLFRVDIAALAARGVLLLLPTTVDLRRSEHRDRLLPLATDADADYSPQHWQSQVESAQLLLQRLQHNVTRLAAVVANGNRRLETWIDALAPATGVGAGVQRRSGEADVLRRRVDELADAVGRLRRNDSASWQPKFADSFCVLASRTNDIPGMLCRSMGFHVPYKSLRYSPIFNRRVRVETSTAGMNHFRWADDKFFRLRLRVCCK